VNEVELREAFNTTNYKLEADRDKRQQLEVNLYNNLYQKKQKQLVDHHIKPVII
jgi:hypothetical protein